ncbi:DUF6544 family protein [Nonomuraea basaltis]|uniref:DUF6544 family protein n=1 Tax=Nonomuraea basaltis TaxID=2495887 RepID=UPI00110C44F4|nr:DUF6544 family protein [Nonomuraea basaltis]TMR93643.1 hypothetical protein EJK15_38395 [Nonomuraea basaltis]
MTVVLAPPHLTEEARHDWQLLQARTRDRQVFDPGHADLLPGAARQWVLHAIKPGTPLLRSVVLKTHGAIRLGQWRRLDAVQVAHRVIASIPVGEEHFDVTLNVAPDGRLTRVSVSRWGNPDKGAYRNHLFGVECEREVTVDGFTIPAWVRGGWWPGTERRAEGEFIRFSVDDALFR